MTCQQCYHAECQTLPNSDVCALCEEGLPCFMTQKQNQSSANSTTDGSVYQLKRRFVLRFCH